MFKPEFFGTTRTDTFCHWRGQLGAYFDICAFRRPCVGLGGGVPAWTGKCENVPKFRRFGQALVGETEPSPLPLWKDCPGHSTSGSYWSSSPTSVSLWVGKALWYWESPLHVPVPGWQLTLITGRRLMRTRCAIFKLLWAGFPEAELGCPRAQAFQELPSARTLPCALHEGPQHSWPVATCSRSARQTVWGLSGMAEGGRQEGRGWKDVEGPGQEGAVKGPVRGSSRGAQRSLNGDIKPALSPASTPPTEVAWDWHRRRLSLSFRSSSVRAAFTSSPGRASSRGCSFW